MPTAIAHTTAHKLAHAIVLFFAGQSTRIIVREFLAQLPHLANLIGAPANWVAKIEDKLKQLPATVTCEQLEEIIYNINIVIPDMQDCLINHEARIRDNSTSIREIQRKIGISSNSTISGKRNSFVTATTVPDSLHRPRWIVMGAGITLLMFLCGAIYFSFSHVGNTSHNNGEFDEKRFEFMINKAEKEFLDDAEK